MRDTTILEKVVPSILNAATAVALSLPALYFFGPTITWKFSAILAFFCMQIIDTHSREQFRCFGMRLYGTRWKKSYTRRQKMTYTFLYTLSFSTLFFSLYAPFDLFIANMLLMQAPAVILTGTTAHGFIAGNMRSVTSLRVNSKEKSRGIWDK